MVAKLVSRDLRHLCYVEVKLESFNDSNSIVSGLFVGVQPLVGTTTQLVSADEMFVWLSRGDQINACNLYSYKIKSIEIGYKVAANAVSTKVERIDDMNQTEFLAQLDEILTAMEKKDAIITDGLIDVDAYVDIPASLKRAESESSASSSVGSTGAGTSRGVAGTGSSYSRGTTTTYEKKEVSTTSIKRTTKYPITSAAGQMQAKIQALRDGTYELPELPELKVDEEGKKSSDTELDADELEEMYGYGFC